MNESKNDTYNNLMNILCQEYDECCPLKNKINKDDKNHIPWSTSLQMSVIRKMFIYNNNYYYYYNGYF